MYVVITERYTGDVKAQYEIHLDRGNYVPPDQHYFDEAWRCAVRDGVVDCNEAIHYVVKLATTANPE